MTNRGRLHCVAQVVGDPRPLLLLLLCGFELAFSVPDYSKPAALPRMIVHTPTSAPQAHLALLSSTDSGTPIPLTTVERGAPIIAFCGVRETSLWLLDDGVFADGLGVRPSFGQSRIWHGVKRACACALQRGRRAPWFSCGAVGAAQASMVVEEDEGEGDEGEGTVF